jgi:hypothetical protein
MAPPFLLHWLRLGYRALQYTYPPEFRRQYGREMEQVFGDRLRTVAQTRGLSGLFRLCAGVGADWLMTTMREGIASMRVPAQIDSDAAPILDGVPVFYMCENEIPPRSALMNGATLSLVAFMAVTFLLAHSGDRRIIRLIGSHHQSHSHMLPARADGVPSKDLEAEINVKPYPDEPPVSAYFKLILVLGALDTDGDNIISAAEISHAGAALMKLDKNHDGKLTAEECGARFGDALRAGPQLLMTRARLEFMRFHPVLAALDADQNGEISASEVKRAPAALATLDKNGDGRLTEDELLPDPLTGSVGSNSGFQGRPSIPGNK